MNEIVWQTVLALLFFALSMVFAASETALVSLSRPRLKKLIAQRRALATAFTEWLAAPQYLLTTILIGNTLSNVLATVLVTNLALTRFPRLRPGVVETGSWLGMLALLFIFGDFIPKSIARYYPERVSLVSLGGISFLSRLATPFIRKGLHIFEKVFPALEGVPVGRLAVYSLEEIREMICASAVEGEFPHRSRQMMERALTLHRLPVSRLMTPFEKIESIHLGWDPEKILDQMAELGRTRVPAYRAHPRKIGGYLHVKDLLLVWRGVLPLKLDALLRQPLFIPPTTLSGDLLEDFRRGGSHLAIVVDAQGDCQGLVTLEDVLEEIVGEILDEYDLENPRGVR